jgi:hypothetical protein
MKHDAPTPMFLITSTLLVVAFVISMIGHLYLWGGPERPEVVFVMLASGALVIAFICFTCEQFSSDDDETDPNAPPVVP